MENQKSSISTIEKLTNDDLPDFVVERPDGTVGSYWVHETTVDELFSDRQDKEIVGYVDGKPIRRKG